HHTAHAGVDLPSDLRNRARAHNEAIDCLIGRSRMVGNGAPYRTGARGPHEIAFDAGFFYNHLLRDGRFSIALFDGVTCRTAISLPGPSDCTHTASASSISV